MFEEKLYVSYSPDEFDGLLNVTISDVMDIVQPERKKASNELPAGNSTESAGNSTNAQTNETGRDQNNQGAKANEEQKVKSDL